MIKQADLIDGERYIVSFKLDDGSTESVAAVWIKEHGVFSFSMGSLSYIEVTKIE